MVFVAYGMLTASCMKSAWKSQIVTSGNYPVTFILSEQVFKVLSTDFHTGSSRSCHMVHCFTDDTLVQITPLNKFAFWRKIFL